MAATSPYLLAAYQLCEQDNGPKHTQTHTLHFLPGAYGYAVMKTLHVSAFYGHWRSHCILIYCQDIPIHIGQ